MQKKLLALLLALVMVCSMGAVTAFAEEEPAMIVLTYSDGSTAEFSTLQAAVDQAMQVNDPEAPVVIELAEDAIIEENVTIRQNNTHLTIRGGSFTGGIFITPRTETNAALDNSKGAILLEYLLFGSAGEDTENRIMINMDGNYARNVTIKNCVFFDDDQMCVGIQPYHASDIVIENCVGIGLHSLIQGRVIQSLNGSTPSLLVKGCTVSQSKSGINLYNSVDWKIEDCTLSAEEYGIRFNEDGAGKGAILGCSISTQSEPVIFRYASNSLNYQVTVQNNLFLTEVPEAGLLGGWLALKNADGDFDTALLTEKVFPDAAENEVYDPTPDLNLPAAGDEPGAASGDAEQADEPTPRDEDGNIQVRSQMPIDTFLRVEVNGEELDPSNYDVYEGSIVVVLHKDYLDSLPSGTYNLSIISGVRDIEISADGTFTVENRDDYWWVILGQEDGKDAAAMGKPGSEAANDGAQDPNPNTGDATVLWLAAGLCVISAAAVMLLRKRAR